METEDNLEPEEASIDQRKLDMSASDLIALGNATGQSNFTFENDHGVGFVKVVTDGKVGLLQIPDTRPPVKLSGTAKFNDVAGFCAYVTKFKGDGTAIYRTGSGDYLAILDGHEGVGTAGRGEHKTTLECTATAQLVEWAGSNAKVNPSSTKRSQKALADFFDDNAEDLVEDLGDITEFILNFKKERTQAINAKAERDSEDVEQGYTDKSNVKDFPFTIRIPIYEGMEKLYEIKGVIRHHVDDDGKLTMWYELKRLDRVFTQADRDVDGEVHATTDIRAYRGSFSQ